MAAEEMERVVFGCCGVEVWLHKSFLKDRRETGDRFYCPNGHIRAFTPTLAEKLQKEMDATNRRLQEKEDKLAKLKIGKCPFCWKTVKNLSAHIKTSHM